MNKLLYLLLFSLFISLQTKAQSPPVNNNCSGAIILLADSICNEQAFSTQNATMSFPSGFWCAGVPDDDVWFRFTATKPRMQMSATGLDFFDATVQFFYGTCGNLSPEPCADATGAGETEDLIIENLIVGQNYYFRVFDRGTIANQSSFVFEVCVIALDPLPNISFDHPCDALADTSLLPVNGTVIYFNNSGTTIDDNEYLITPANGVCEDYDYSGWCSDDGIQNSSWGAFIAPASGAVEIDVCNNGQTEILTQLALYSYTDCNNFSTYTFIAGNEVSPDCAMGSQLSTCNLTPGQTYLILVDGYQIAMGNVTISISEVQDPYAGVNNSLSICKNTPDFNLLDALPGADPTGFWIDADNTGNLINGTFNAENTPAGTFEFIYVVEGFTCFANDSARVTITTLPIPNAGANGVQLSCSAAGEIDLFLALNGNPEPGGYWLDPNGAPFDGMYDPDVDPIGIYNYIIASTNGACPQDSAYAGVLTIITIGVDAGEDAEIDVCTNTPPFMMVDELGGSPDANGLWFDEDANQVNAIFDPAIQLAGNYFYIVSAPGCGSDFAILTINIGEGPDAGMDADSSLCFNGPVVDLMGMIGGSPDAGGVWTDSEANVVSNLFDPAMDPAGDYFYTVTTLGCPIAESTISINIDNSANAGSNSLSWTCYDAADFFLITLLGGSPQAGGSWTDPNGDAHDGFFNPGTDIPGAYTYTINGACDSASAVLTVNVEIEPYAGTGPGEAIIVDVAINDNIDLWDQLSDVPEPSGSWVDLDNSGGLSGSIFTATALMDGNTYSFAYVVYNVCGSDTAFVNVSVVNSDGIEERELLKVDLFPNPSHNAITITSPSLNGSYDLRICDLSGRILISEKINFANSKATLNFDLKAGNYLLSIFDSTQPLVNQALIVQ